MTSGRKKNFDETTALEAAMNVFWQKGYIGASLSELTTSMGINKPSMYSTFGNKEALFIKATDFYVETKMKSHLAALHQQGKTLPERLKNYMRSIVAMQCDSQQAKGCYLALCQSEIVGGEIPAEATSLLKKIEQMPKQLLTELFENEPESITAGLNVNAEKNALSIYTMLKGTASMARSGVEFVELEYVIDTCINGLIAVHN